MAMRGKVILEMNLQVISRKVKWKLEICFSKLLHIDI